MSISYQFGDVDAHGALIRSQAASLESEHQSIVRDVLAGLDRMVSRLRYLVCKIAGMFQCFVVKHLISLELSRVKPSQMA